MASSDRLRELRKKNIEGTITPEEKDELFRLRQEETRSKVSGAASDVEESVLGGVEEYKKNRNAVQSKVESVLFPKKPLPPFVAAPVKKEDTTTKQGEIETLGKEVQKEPPSKEYQPSSFNWQKEYKNFYDMVKTNPDAVPEDVKNAKKKYEEARTSADKSEALQKIINGIGRVAAGLYGQREGVDMSQVKFSEPDTTKDKELAYKEFVNAVDESARKQQRAFGEKSLAAQMTAQKAADEARDESAMLRKTLQDMKVSSEGQNKVFEELEETTRRIADISKDKKLDSDTKRESIRNLLLSTIKDEGKVDKMMKDKFLLWETEADTDTILKRLAEEKMLEIQSNVIVQDTKSKKSYSVPKQIAEQEMKREPGRWEIIK